MADLQISLTGAEALVLFEWLSQLEEMDSPPFADPSERTVAWRIHGQLESVLREPLAPDYYELLARARQEVQENVD